MLLVPTSVGHGLTTLGKEIKFELLPAGRREGNDTSPHPRSGLKQFRFFRLTLLVVSQGSGGLEALQSQELQKVI